MIWSPCVASQFLFWWWWLSSTFSLPNKLACPHTFFHFFIFLFFFVYLKENKKIPNTASTQVIKKVEEKKKLVSYICLLVLFWLYYINTWRRKRIVEKVNHKKILSLFYYKEKIQITDEGIRRRPHFFFSL